VDCAAEVSVCVVVFNDSGHSRDDDRSARPSTYEQQRKKVSAALDSGSTGTAASWRLPRQSGASALPLGSRQ
jgi:hypothetical protein